MCTHLPPTHTHTPPPTQTHLRTSTSIHSLHTHTPLGKVKDWAGLHVDLRQRTRNRIFPLKEW